MKRTLTKMMAAAFAALGLNLAARAAGTTGDLYEIEKLIGDYGITPTYPTAGNPIEDGGQEIRFVLHLAATDADSPDVDPETGDYSNWYLNYIGTGSSPVDDVMNPLRIGIVVSGRLQWATRIADYDNDSYEASRYDNDHIGFKGIHDVVFSYKTKPGDNAMPIRLALEGSTEEHPIAAFGTSSKFMWQNADKWWFANKKGDPLNLSLVTSARRATMQDLGSAFKNPSSDLTLAQAGFYVRTVNFVDADPSEWEQPNVYWRHVECNSGVTGQPAEMIVNGTPSEKARLYAWTTNETVVSMSGGKATKMGMPWDDGLTTNTYKVATIEIVGGKSDGYLLPLWGESVSETPVDVFVSQYDGFRYDASGHLVEDFLVTKVRCIEAPKPGVKISFDERMTEFTYNKGEAVVAPYDAAIETAIPIYVTLSDRKGLPAEFEDGVDILLNPELVKDPTVDVFSNNYITVSLDPTIADEKRTSVHFDKGVDQVTAYLFVRGGDLKTATGIRFTPESTNDAFNAAYTGDRTSARINVRDAMPLLQLPEDGLTVTADAISGFDLNLQVLDCYRDMMSTNFTVSLGYTTAKNVEFARDITTKVHFISPGNSGEYKYSLTVTDQNGNTSTNKVGLTITVTPPKTVSCEFVADAEEGAEPIRGTTYQENSNGAFSKVKDGTIYRPIPRFTLSDPNNSGATLYAFLVPLTEAASNYVSCAAFTEGVAIPLYETTSVPNDKFRMTFLDGCSETSYLEFGIVLRTGSKLTDEVYGDFAAPKNVNLTVKNVEPEIVKFTYNGTPHESGDTVHVGNGVAASFTMTVDDASKIDLTNDTQRIVTVWRFEDDAGSSTYQYLTNTVGSTVTCTNVFYGGGSIQKLYVYAYDKDMDPETDAGETFEVTIAVDDSPFVYFTAEDKWLPEGSNRVDELTVLETDPVKKRYFWVYLSAPAGSKFTERYPLEVNLKVDKLGSTGAMTLSTEKITFIGGQKGGGNKFRVTLNDLDGGEQDDSLFQVTATPTWKGSEKDSGYIGATMEVTVEDVAPAIVKPTDIQCNKTNSVVAGTSVQIPFKATDIPADANLTVTVVGPSNEDEYDYVSGVDTSFTYNFLETDSGAQDIVITVTDKDGYPTSKTMHYIIPAFKTLRITPYGPAPVSQSRYNGVTAGLGKGIVWADGPRAITNDSHRVSYIYGEETNQGEAYARGLAGDEAGGIEGYDSFFYSWIDLGLGSEGKGEDKGGSQQTPRPTPTSQTASPPFTVALDPFEAGKAAYEARAIEAIFSRERYPSDNMGDINQDGIPDLYMQFAWQGGMLGGVFDDNLARVGNDLTKVDGLNADEDYLPATYVSRYGSLIPDLEGTWVTYGTPFKAVTEIRGYHWGLNDAPSQTGIQNVKPERVYAVTDEEGNLAWDGEKCTLSELEFIAFTNWCGRQEAPLDPADKTNWAKWSPECPTDPTVADTDEDGFPDGYEYYFWYRAHVGYIDGDGTYRRMEGRRFDPTNPAIPVIIPADDIADLMNPRVACAEEDYNTRDSDNDGLVDAVEFERGTNPFDFDTDGDGLPDGYEIAVTGTDPLLYATDKIHPDGELNPDHDFKAETEMPLNWVDLVNAETPGATNRVWAAEAFVFTNVETVVTEDPYETTTNKQVHSHGKLVDAWRYGSGDPEAPWALGGTNALQSVTGAVWTVVANGAEKVKVLHYQVFMKDGFDPRVGWNDPKPAKEGHIITTTPFTHLDEFLVMSFYYRNGGVAAGDLVATLGKGGRTWEEIWTDNCTNPLDADTDHDGMPDGWELYIQMGSGKGEKPEKACGPGPECIYSPLYDFAEVTDPQERDPDQDKLDFVEEFAGIESTGRYSPTCPTIQLTPDQEKWQNKWWCTNPYNKDTDDDGIDDGAEFDFIWDGAKRKAAIDDEGCVEGGGLNPLSWDTDLDGLPDPFEQEFKGKGDWVADAGGAAAPASTNATGAASTNATASAGGKWNGLGLNGTLNDARGDCDHDGLANWQEYMTAAMRCWRYDDTVNDWSDGTFDPVKGKYEYFSLCTNAFEQDAWVMEPQVYMHYYMFRDGYYHDLAKNTPNRFTERDHTPMPSYSLFNRDGTAIFPHKYICTSPLEADTDHDGMDDYYELFHGLNPLLGESGVSSTTTPCDIVLDSYWLDLPPWSAEANYWIEGSVKHLTRPETPLRNTGLSGGSAYDFFQFPWLGGLARADVDGDNIRNQTESIMPGVQAASTYHHTDPTPLWMTDSSYGASLTKRYYYMSPAVYELDPPPMTITERWMGALALGTMFSFEENEGFDSDHDFLGDFEETQGKTKTASDPQWHDSPLRRQAMWLNGEDAFLQTALPEFETAPNSTGVSTVGQNYLYFTVECWAKPDGETLDREQTLVERSVWTGPAGPADEKYLRKNFLIGIKNGRWYAKFDSDGVDKAQAVEITNGPEATTNWTHVAFTYGPANDDQNDPSQPMRPRLYVNGVRYNGDTTAIHPEHGISALFLNEVNEEAGYSEWSTLIGPLVSFTVGASAETMQGICFDILYRAGGLLGEATLDDYGRFYRGYVDEVRIWDGARLEKDIRHDYEQRVRYTDETALANREAFHKKWSSGGTRNPQSPEDLPARLMHHWAFDHIAGAVDPKDLMDVPAGFRTGEKVTDGMAVWARPKDWKNPWLNTVAVRSTVYTDTAWVPWINDTVCHLPRYDRTTVDSVYWSADYAGTLSAQDAGYAQFYFPRRGEVPSRWVQMCCEEAPFTQDARYNLVSTNAEIAADYDFTMLDRQTAGFDLLPMGGAYPKRISAAEGGMWDDQGAADAWAETGTDADHNGLPEWWERYARANYAKDLSPWEPFAWDTDVVCEGLRMKAWQAYMRDLARGMLPDGERHEEFIDSRDVDMDGIPDWWEDLYSIDTHSVADALADPDGDGLGNYVEYLITEKFKYAQLDPGEAKSDGVCVDYFRRVGDLYLGEIFTDHDQVNDVWENKYAGFADFSAYDPSRDDDGDGWSNFAEQKAGTDPRLVKETGIDDYTLAGYPVPCIRARIVNNGHTVETAPVVIKAWSERSDPGMTGDPDATWTIAGSATGAEGAQQPTTGTDGEQKAGAEMGASSKYLGIKPDGTRTLTLGPGAIERNSVKIFYKDLSYCKAVIIGNQVIPTEIGDESAAQWYYLVHDREGKLYTTGGIFAGEEEVGTVDYDTGAVTIDFGNDALCGISLGDAGTTDGDGETPTYDLLNLDQSYVLVTWNSSARSGSLNRTLYLSDADDQGDISGRFDHVREGLNTFIAFVDRDGDGAYTAGEPYGFVRGVDVGWSGAEFEIELTETSPVFARVNVFGGASGGGSSGGSSGNAAVSDRQVIWGTSCCDTPGSSTGSNDTWGVSANAHDHVRIVPYMVAGVYTDGEGSNSFVYAVDYVENRVVAEFDVRSETKPYITEADFIRAGAFDIDWDGFSTSAFANNSRLTSAVGEVTAVKYRVIFGNEGPIGAESNLDASSPGVSSFHTLIERRFERTADRTKPTGLSVDGVVCDAQPHFGWRLDEPTDVQVYANPNTGVSSYVEPAARYGCSYTAFQIQVADRDGNVVYDSGVVRAPVRDADGFFRWTPTDLYAGDQTALGKVFAATGNWQWRVAMYNSKFKPNVRETMNGWSAWQLFSTSVGTGNTLGDLARETIDVSVKYTGPVKVLDGCEDLAKTKGTVRLQAFVSPDFSGEPVAQGFVTNRASLVDVADTAANGRLIGLMPGEYYLRAYVDTNGNLVKDDWESWGAAAEAVTVGPGIKVPEIRIYIEDADTDQDWIPDAWEMQVNGSLTKDNVYVLPDGQIKFKLIYPETEKTAKTTLKSAAAPVTFFQNLNAVRFVLTSETTDSDGDALTDILAATQPKAVPGTVAITSLALDANKGEAVLKVTGETEKSDEAELLDAIYVFPDQPLTLNVYRKNSLAEKDWTLVKENIPVILGSGTEEEVRVSLGDEIDPTSGFYMIKVVQ